jgi:predicted dehydrogenase
MSSVLNFALWGGNGHQIQNNLERYPRLKLAAFGGFSSSDSDKLSEQYPEATLCESLEDILKQPGVQLISLCSPLRSEQADDAIRCLSKNISVYAEKPCAMNEADLDRILAAASKSQAHFHEMSGTLFEQPYWAMHKIIQSGSIGDVIQVSAQKSYPFYEGRPLSEDVDGGQVAQNGVHALRFVEHVCGVEAADIQALSTTLGEDRDNSDLKMAASMMGTLDNGGLFSIVANYLNPKGFPSWGNEMLRVFGSRGMLESCDGGQRTRWVVGDVDHGSIDTSETAPDFLNLVIAHVADGTPLPFSLETELHPTRMVLRARASDTNTLH